MCTVHQLLTYPRAGGRTCNVCWRLCSSCLSNGRLDVTSE